MTKKTYIIPELQQVKLGLPKTLCDGGDIGNTDPSTLASSNRDPGIGMEAPGRIKLYF